MSMLRGAFIFFADLSSFFHSPLIISSSKNLFAHTSRVKSGSLTFKLSPIFTFSIRSLRSVIS